MRHVIKRASYFTRNASLLGQASSPGKERNFEAAESFRALGVSESCHFQENICI